MIRAGAMRALSAGMPRPRRRVGALFRDRRPWSPDSMEESDDKQDSDEDSGHAGYDYDS